MQEQIIQVALCKHLGVLQAQLKEQREAIALADSAFEELDKKMIAANLATLQFTQTLISEGVKAGKSYQEIFKNGEYETQLQKYAEQLKARGATEEEVKDSLEAFTSSSTTFIMPVVEIDDYKIGSGLPGKITLELRDLYIRNIMKDLI